MCPDPAMLGLFKNKGSNKTSEAFELINKIEKLFQLDGKVIVITGAGRGIGNFLASELSKMSAVLFMKYILQIDGMNDDESAFFVKVCKELTA